MIEWVGIKKNYVKLRKGDNISKDVESILEFVLFVVDKKWWEVEKDSEDDEGVNDDDDVEFENIGLYFDW